MMDKAVGAGLTICNGLPVVEEESIPTGPESEVYDSELIVIGRPAEICTNHILRDDLINKRVIIFNDNQAALHRLTSLRTGPGQSTAILIAQLADQLHHQQSTLTVQWVPGHTDIPGNERADALAKAATEMRPPTYYTTTLSYLKRRAKEKMKTDWHAWWEDLPQWERGKNYSATPQKEEQRSCEKRRTCRL